MVDATVDTVLTSDASKTYDRWRQLEKLFTTGTSVDIRAGTVSIDNQFVWDLTRDVWQTLELIDIPDQEKNQLYTSFQDSLLGSEDAFRQGCSLTIPEDKDGRERFIQVFRHTFDAISELNTLFLLPKELPEPAGLMQQMVDKRQVSKAFGCYQNVGGMTAYLDDQNLYADALFDPTSEKGWLVGMLHENTGTVRKLTHRVSVFHGERQMQEYMHLVGAFRTRAVLKLVLGGLLLKKYSPEPGAR